MKKLLSIVLALALVFTMTVIPAFAEGTVVAYYVGDTQDGEAVAAAAGETYLPDRMPTTAAPDGYYFVGWADANGEIVSSTTGIVVAEGENKLTAVYKPYKAETEVGLSYHEQVANQLNIGYMKGEQYYSYVEGRTSGAPKAEYIANDENGESYLQVSPSAGNSGDTAFPLADADGDVIQFKPSTNYKVTVTYRIPENNGTLVLRCVFGGKIDVADSTLCEAPSFRNQYGNAMGYTTGYYTYPYFSGSGVPALTAKWHDHGGYQFRFGESVENPAVIEDWATYTFNVSTPAYNDTYLSNLFIVVATDGNAKTQKFQIKSIKVVDTTMAAVQYVVNDEVVDTIDGLAGGATYVVDRIPETAAPAGTYFAGWKNEAGEYVREFTLEGGTTKLYASYVEFPGKGTSWGTYVWPKGKAFSAPYVTTGGELKLYATSGSWLNYESVDYEGETVMRAPNGNTWGTTAFFLIPNADGSVMQIEPGKKYNVTVTYMNPHGASVGFGMAAGLREDLITGSGSTTQGMAKNVGSLVSADDPDIAGTQTWTYTLHSNGHHAWTIKNTSTEWQTLTMTVSTSADYTGYLPTIYFYTSMSASNKFYIKDITIADANYKEPATVTYYVNDAQDGATVTGLKETQTYALKAAPDALPEGYNFVAWKDAQGNVVTNATLVAGDNKFYAELKELPTVTYYVNGVQEGETITDIEEGATYTPDRMPTAEAPAGKYFIGWKLNGKYVVDSFNVAAGENRLEASYVDYVSGTVSADVLNKNLPKTLGGTQKILLPSVVDGVYQGHYAPNGWAASTDGSDETGTFVRHNANSTWGENTLRVLHNENGEALIAKPSTQYKIEVTYRLAAYPESFTYNYEDWSNGGARTNWLMYVMVGANAAKRSSLASDSAQNGNYGKATATEHHTWFDHGPGLGFWADIAGDGEWHTETLTITTHSAEKYVADNHLPVFSYHTGSPSNQYKIDVKSVVITEVAATVNYYVDDEVVKTVNGIKSLDGFKADYIPDAPDGKFFAGWKDEAGNFVTNSGATLDVGENNFYAAFGNVLTSGSVNAYLASGAMKYPNYDSNGANYQATLPGGNYYNKVQNTEYEGKTYHSLVSNGNANVKVSLVDENGYPIVFEPGKSYNISMKFKTVNGKGLSTMVIASGYNASSEAGLRTGIGNSFQAGGKTAILLTYTSQNVALDDIDSWQWNVTTGGHNTHSLPAYDDWQIADFAAALPADYTGYYPVFMMDISLPSGETVIFDYITVTEVGVEKDFETATFGGKEYGAVKVADNVEDNATYRITMVGAASAWANIYFMTADSDDIYSNQSHIRNAENAHSTAFGYAWNVTSTVYITVDKANGQGDALYLYTNNPAKLTSLLVVNVEKVEGVDNGGAAILADQPEDAKQAIRFFFDYKTTTGADIVIGGKNIAITERGFLIADASKVDGAVVNYNSGNAIKAGTSDFTKCWDVTDTGTGIETLTFSTYIKGFKAEDGTYNASQKIYVKGYIVLADGSVIYSEETVTTVADIAAELGLN